MSLKAIHVIFIIASVSLCLGFAAWAFWMASSQEPDRGLNLGMGTASLVLGVGLVIYGRYFLRKLRSVSYL